MAGLNGLGSPTGFGGLGGNGSFGGGGAGAGGLGALAGLNPQTLQSLLALQAGNLGGGAGGITPALLARLSGQGGLGGLGSNDLGGQSDGQGFDGGNLQGGGPPHSYNPVGQSNFAPFSPAQSPIAHNSSLPSSQLGQNGFSANDARRDDYGRYDEQMLHQQQLQRDDELHDQFSNFSQRQSSVGGSSAPSERDFLNGMYSSGSTAATSPTTSTRIPGSYSQSHPSAPSHLRSVTSPGSEVSSPFDSHFRPPPLQTSSSYSSDHSSRFFGGGAFSPPATAPGMPGQDYLQQAQQLPSRARAASASVHTGGGINDLAAEMESLAVGSGRLGTGPGSGRSFGYGSFGGATLRSQLSGSRYQGGGRFDEGQGL